MRLLLACAPLLLLSACGSDDSSREPSRTSDGSCYTLTDGSAYNMHMAEQSGNCGAMPDAVIVMGDTSGSTCVVNSKTVDASSCSSTVSQSCTMDDGTQTKAVAKLTVWDSNEASGTIDLTISGSCHSVYSVTYSAL